MKIGILTFFDGCNFGEQLQAYTSQQYFESLGHDVWIINYSMDREEYNYSRYPNEQANAHRNFAKMRLKSTKRLSQDEILTYVVENGFDVVAFGADAIWNKRNRVNLSVYTAQWLNNVSEQNTIGRSIKCIGLSPAFMGSTYSDLTEYEKESFKAGLLRFTFPNTRDEWTREIVNREIMGYEFIKRTNPDPVFLLNYYCTDRWNSIRKDILSKEYYVISLPKLMGNSQSMNRWILSLKKEVNRRGYKLVELPLPEGVYGKDVFDFTVPYPIDPLQWFLWLKNAKGYIGLRFHAVVSCISALTPFFSLDIYGNVPRWMYYLNRLGFHRLDRRLNKGSKIRNLLESSSLESFRMNGFYINRIKPKRLVDKLENCDIELIRRFRDSNVEKFQNNMREALS